MTGKRVLVTGAAGFIGRQLCRRLIGAGAEVYGTSRAERTGDPLGIEWWQGAFDEIEFARNVINGVQPHYIFHLAGMVSASNDMAHVLPAYHSLVTSTVNLLTLAAEAKVQRTIIIGSSNEPVGQDPNSPYAAAKSASSMYGRLFHKLYNQPIVVARPFVGYGPGQPSDKLIPYVMSQLLNGERPKLSNGLWKTDWIYIDDMVEGILRCALVPGIEGCTIDIGTGELASVREVVETVVGLLGPAVTPNFGALPDRFAEHTPVADTEHTWEKLRWKASVGLHDGLKRTVEEFISTRTMSGAR